MAKKKQIAVYLIPEGQSTKSHDYHYIAQKSTNMTREGGKLRLKKYNPKTRKHEWFVEAKLPPHSK